MQYSLGIESTERHEEDRYSVVRISTVASSYKIGRPRVKCDIERLTADAKHASVNVASLVRLG